ncbi:MAG: hypothetical protein JW927_13345 [Deltaproteobacteria bacterium]|nr:hypothetical protein [Deltaproteobacteria bacterium]
MECPKCESDVENKASGFWLGFLGKAAFPKYVCPKCGKLDFSDFNEDTRKKILMIQLEMNRFLSGCFA